LPVELHHIGDLRHEAAPFTLQEICIWLLVS
jgi:hypothetical protein